MAKKWLHAVFVLPDERILLERLTFNQIGYAPPKKIKWTISIGVQSWEKYDPNVKPGIHSNEVATLERILFRRLGVRILDSPGLQVLHLLSHKVEKSITSRMSHLTKTMEVFRVKAFNNITLYLNGSSETKAMFRAEIMARLDSGMFDEESIATMNMIEAMGINL